MKEPEAGAPHRGQAATGFVRRAPQRPHSTSEAIGFLVHHSTFASLPTIAIGSVVERLRERLGVEGPPTTSKVEAGHLRRFAQAIGDPNPRWLAEAPPTFLVALAPASYHAPEAEEYGHGWLNGGNRFELIEPVRAGDEITATSKIADVYEKRGSSGNLLFIVFETSYANQHGTAVARVRGTAIRR